MQCNESEVFLEKLLDGEYGMRVENAVAVGNAMNGSERLKMEL